MSFLLLDHATSSLTIAQEKRCIREILSRQLDQKPLSYLSAILQTDHFRASENIKSSIYLLRRPKYSTNNYLSINFTSPRLSQNESHSFQPDFISNVTQYSVSAGAKVLARPKYRVPSTSWVLDIHKFHTYATHRVTKHASSRAFVHTFGRSVFDYHRDLARACILQKHARIMSNRMHLH